MKPLVTDELWAVVAPLLPRRLAYPKGGRPWVDDRATLNGILYVLRGGVPWRLLRTELGYGSRARVVARCGRADPGGPAGPAAVPPGEAARRQGATTTAAAATRACSEVSSIGSRAKESSRRRT